MSEKHLKEIHSEKNLKLEVKKWCGQKSIVVKIQKKMQFHYFQKISPPKIFQIITPCIHEFIKVTYRFHTREKIIN